MPGYLTNLDVAEEFFTRCIEKEAVTQEERLAILDELVKELKAVKLSDEDIGRYLINKRALIVNKKAKKV